jgi:CheY-like chemotaxis protein
MLRLPVLRAGRQDVRFGGNSLTEKILLVEDSRYLRMAARQVLSDAGFIIVEASDGEEALQKARESEPDLIILDMLLPKLGGERVLQALQQDPATARIPVIVLSSLSQGNADKLKEAGATAYIEKSKLDLTKGGENLVRLVNATLREAIPLVGA